MTDLVTHVGWVWLLAALGTTIVAITLAASRIWHPALRPQVQHRVAVASLALCLVVVAFAPLVLTLGDDGPAPSSAAPPRSSPIAVASSTPSSGTSQPVREGTQTANAVAAAVGAIWISGAVLMAARLLGGWVVVRRLVGGARPVELPAMQGDLARLQAVMGVGVPVELLESPQVDVPIIVGCRPVLILPPDLQKQRSREALEPLLAHELAHVVRRDYLMNMLQSAADAVLFAFPGARWISARIRETREYCCDEMALQVCGDTRRYVEALAGIATLSVARQPVAALGVGGPRLATRIRRLLHGDPDVRYRRTRLIALAGSAALFVVAGDRATGFAAAHVAQLQPSEGQRAVTDSALPFAMTFAYSYEQPGSAVVVGPLTHGVAFACESAAIRNNANVAVTGIAFVAVAELWRAEERLPVQIFTTDVIPVEIAPGAKADVDIHLLPEEDWMRLGGMAPHVQVMCALTKVTYANGATWEVTPNPAVRTAEAALSFPPAEVSRSQFSRAATQGWVCLDDRGGEYSVGALVAIRNEPGTLAQCVDATPAGQREHVVRWIEYRPAPPK